jgi:hypothetical protein
VSVEEEEEEEEEAVVVVEEHVDVVSEGQSSTPSDYGRCCPFE